MGHPSRDYLWILSRTPTVESAIYDGIITRLEDRVCAQLVLASEPTLSASGFIW